MPVDRYIAEADHEARRLHQRDTELSDLRSETSLPGPATRFLSQIGDTALHGRGNGPMRSAVLLGTQSVAGNRSTTRMLQRTKDTEEPARYRPVNIQRCASCGDINCHSGEQCGATPAPEPRKRKRALPGPTGGAGSSSAGGAKGRKAGTQYAIGTHGAKRAEQSRLGDLFGITVSGETHESEHAIGFEVLNRTSGLERGTAGRAKTLENLAPAYQEVKELHRAHIGTGMHGTPDQSGFTSEQYRDAQRNLTEEGRAGDAVQLNQLGYAFNPSFGKSVGTTYGKAASASYDAMVEGMGDVQYAQGARDLTSSVSPEQQAEMWLARRVAQGQGDPTRGGWPTDEQIAQAYDLFGLKKPDKST